ncbi:DNA excision repair protein Rad16 [Rasamsonia emersonii CBS 393.64]|uniref:DNA excision repair protein Rad16 n=1 Tax=Rasamsonia emersonii (strain ATCC 16479 / CBS 393.64 / IMI 116815) TaxID=1408163 RepID=A0A0F4YSR8_RASE3|nr:DNA excision repair protein Rad16 [Rasamsonia emersonii CBS 393.64]KKA21130.1 DNA excision repair protein Rad16 [Rasamsonia emersonii CBS 393.64]
MGRRASSTKMPGPSGPESGAVQSKGPSSNSTPFTTRSSTRLTRASSNLASANRESVEKDTMKKDENYELDDRPTAPLTAVEVAIPVKKESPSNGSSTSPSVEITSRDVSLYGTPATSVAATPVESDRNQPRKRVNASARLQELRASTYSMTSSSTGRKRGAAALSADESTTESSDAALARALQLEEYEGTETKRQRLSSGGSKRILEIQDSTDDDDAMLTELDSLSDAEEPIRQPSPHRETRKSIQHKGIVPGTDESSLSDLDSSNARLVDDLDDSMDEVLYEDSSDESISDYVSSPSDVDGDLPMPQRGTGSARRGARRVQSLAPPRRDPLPYGMSRRAIRERRKLERQHPSIVTMWDDLKKQPTITPVAAEQPAGITRKLKSFQLEGLNWMMRQEKTQYKGGLLGDEMGMGKTIQAVSLLMSDYPVGKPSLVVVPPVALMQWQSEIKEYTDGKLKVLVYHNSNPKVKRLKKKDLEAYDVIMISYSGLESMYRKELKGWNRDDGIVKEDSVIHSIHFHRLILDEAHNIKQRTTSVARACFALKATYKWCLSGTPVQNRIGEFFSLLRFLEVRPFACYFCKMCQCQQLHWSQDREKRCTHCKHSGFSHVSIFNQEILNPITERNNPNARKDALDKLRLITDRIMLRRMKKDHISSMELPPKREIERDFSTSIMTNSTRQFDTYVSRGVMLNNYANIFGLIMQMRQVANHPDLILKKHAEGGQNVLVCSICDEPAEEPIRSRCHHEFCRQCAKDYVRSFDADTVVDCPRCHIPLSIDFEQPDIEQEEEAVKKNSIINRIRMEDWTSSTKIEMLVYDLYKLRSKKQTHKSIVFSQFTSMLQLVEWRLRRAGFNTVMLDGSMTPAQRQNSIEHFMKNVNVEVFLVSLKAGGVALNLTEASRVFIVDPVTHRSPFRWWNPAAEWQSADRCHRIGQRRPCVITRLVIEDSVESRIVLLQEKKANMIKGTINKDQGEALEKLTPEDMQFLFRGS